MPDCETLQQQYQEALGSGDTERAEELRGELEAAGCDVPGANRDGDSGGGPNDPPPNPPPRKP